MFSGVGLQNRYWLWGWAAFAALNVTGPAAYAQRADENIVKTADDAFGSRVGSENIGLYSSSSARGFNPAQAGNTRFEGLYFDQQAFMGRTVVPRTSIRVGLSAQSYPFPAPTGIVDIALFIPDDKTTFSFIHETRRPTGLNLELFDFKTPINEKVSISADLGGFHIYSDGDQHANLWLASSVVRWRPADDLEVIPFFYFQRSEDGEVSPSVFTGGAYLPPRIDRGVFYGQAWADRSMDELTYGVVARGNAWDNWRLQAGLFQSDLTRPKNYVVFYRNVQPNGVGSLDILRYPEHSADSVSGEARASGTFTNGAFRHTVHFAVRGRDTRRLFGGGTTTNYGTATIGVERAVSELDGWRFGARDRDAVKQVSPGVSYVSQWANVGEFSVGLQKSFYRRNSGKENASPTTTKSQPWLYNGTLAYYATPKLAFYSGYTRGLEEFGTAPDNAANAGEPLAAQLTKQVDAGLRYTIKPGLTFVGGVFEVSKPYFDRDPANVYSVVGSLKHSGVEMSLSGQPFTGLTVVAGAVFLKARVSGLPVDNGLIGKISPGTAPRLLRLNLQYGAPSWKGFTIEANVENEGSQVANRANTLRVPSLTTLSAAARYPFAVGDAHVNVRVQVINLLDTFAWTVEGNSGRFTSSPARAFFFRIAADY